MVHRLEDTRLLPHDCPCCPCAPRPRSACGDGPLNVSEHTGSDRPAASPSSHGRAHGASSDHDTVALIVGVVANGRQYGGGLAHADAVIEGTVEVLLQSVTRKY